MEALGALINRLCRGNASGWAGSLNEAIARPAILPGVLLGGVGLWIIRSRCQWSITSALVPPRH